MEQLQTILQNANVRRVIGWAVLSLIIWLIIKYAFPKVADKTRYALLGAKNTDGSGEPTEERKSVLKQIAFSVHDAINGYPGELAFNIDLLGAWNGLNDEEFIWAYEYYESEFGSNPACDVDWEDLAGDSADEKFIERAQKLKLPVKITWNPFSSC